MSKKADDLFGPETEAEMQAAADHPMMQAFIVQETRGLLAQLLSALGADDRVR